MRTGEDGLRVEVGPLTDGGAQAMLEAAALPGVGNVFERVADDVRVADHERLHIHVAAR